MSIPLQLQYHEFTSENYGDVQLKTTVFFRLWKNNYAVKVSSRQNIVRTGPKGWSLSPKEKMDVRKVFGEVLDGESVRKQEKKDTLIFFYKFKFNIVILFLKDFS